MIVARFLSLAAEAQPLCSSYMNIRSMYTTACRSTLLDARRPSGCWVPARNIVSWQGSCRGKKVTLCDRILLLFLFFSSFFLSSLLTR